jgi:hypothetical protein
LLSVIFEDQAGATLKIDEGAFDGCSGLSSIQLNSSANDATISIGSYAFNNCVSLKGFTRGTTDTKTFKVTAIDTYAFSMCPNLVIGHLDADPVSSPLTYDTNVFTLKNDTDPKTNKIHGFAVVKKDTTEIVGCLAIGN